jgi:ribonuclease HI
VAVVRALSAIKDRERYVLLHSDSEYAIGALTQDWKVRANKDVVVAGRALVRRFPRLRCVWVPGHAGIAENERCDALARLAIQTHRGAGQRVLRS